MLGDTDHLEKMSERLGITPEDIDKHQIDVEISGFLGEILARLLSEGANDRFATRLVAMSAFVAVDAILCRVQEQETRL